MLRSSRGKHRPWGSTFAFPNCLKLGTWKAGRIVRCLCELGNELVGALDSFDEYQESGGVWGTYLLIDQGNVALSFVLKRHVGRREW